MDCIRKAADNAQLDRLLDPDWDSASPTNAFIKLKNNNVKDRPQNFFAPFGPLINKIGYFRQAQLNGFLITSSKLSHTEGMIVSSAEDRIEFVTETLGLPGPEWMTYKTKPIIATPAVKKGIEENFAPPLWPANPWYYLPEMDDTMQSLKTIQNTYHAGNGGDMAPGQNRPGPAYVKQIHDRSKFFIRTFAFKDGDYDSSAFLVANEAKLTPKGLSVLYIGDTDGRDLGTLWDGVAPIVRMDNLRTIFIPCAYDADDPRRKQDGVDGNKRLHLTPEAWALQFQQLETKLGEQKKLAVGRRDKLDVVVMGIRPQFYVKKAEQASSKEDKTAHKIKVMKKAITEAWKAKSKKALDINFVFPESTDILYISKKRFLTDKILKEGKPVEKGVAVPSLFGGYGLRDVYNDYPALRGPGNYDGSGSYFLEEAAVIFGGLMIVVCTLCFLFGVVFGAGLPTLKRWRLKNRNKRMN